MDVKALWRAFIHGLIDHDENVASSKNIHEPKLFKTKN